MIPTGPTKFKDTQGVDLTEKVEFDELIGICVDEGRGIFYGYAESTDGRFYCSHFTESGPAFFLVGPWHEVEKASILVASMVEGNNWFWLHKKICPQNNWDYMKQCIGWAIGTRRGEVFQEPTFKTEETNGHSGPAKQGAQMKIPRAANTRTNCVYTLTNLE